jgi:hypothetical protein
LPTGAFGRGSAGARSSRESKGFMIELPAAEVQRRAGVPQEFCNEVTARRLQLG